MRVVIAILLLLPCRAFSQKAILIDRGLRYPVSVTDSVTFEQVTKGFMPVYFEDIDSLLEVIDGLRKYIDTGRRNGERVEDIKFGNSHCFTTTIKRGNANKYHIVVGTQVNKVTTSMVLVSGEMNKRAIQRLTIFSDYLKNNRAVLKED
jgi:hypothetical protein